jgi:cell division protein FtsQ
MRFLTRRRALAAAVVAALGALWGLHEAGAFARAAGATEERVLAWTAGLGLAVRDLTVEGRQHANRQAVLDAVGATPGMPILGLDLAEAKRRIETIPWVRSAAVQRQLPDRIDVRLIEREAMALWQRDGKLAVIDRDGVVIAGERPENFANVILLVGSDAPANGAELLDMLASEPALAPHVAAAVRIGGRRWNLRLDNGIDVALPEADPAAAWRRLAALERSDGLLERGIELVDLRFPDRLVLRTPEPQKPARR